MASTMAKRSGGTVATVRRGAMTLGGVTAVLWAVQAMNWLLQGGLTGLGVHPRSLDGLWGILFAPFLHGSWAHLAVNTVSFLILGALTMARKPMDFWVVSAAGAVSSGLGAWLIGGANTVHVGASGVIFAYLGFLMARGWFERRPGAILTSVFVTWAFGGMIWGVLPTVGALISWEAHLFGFLGGVAVARLLGTAVRKSG
ncbi:MAG: membrane associated rhomboid family serine protease [Myxococcota bacterium]|jgi:membrane associated rhomboid family serine protease